MPFPPRSPPSSSAAFGAFPRLPPLPRDTGSGQTSQPRGTLLLLLLPRPGGRASPVRRARKSHRATLGPRMARSRPSWGRTGCGCVSLWVPVDQQLPGRFASFLPGTGLQLLKCGQGVPRRCPRPRRDTWANQTGLGPLSGAPCCTSAGVGDRFYSPAPKVPGALSSTFICPWKSGVCCLGPDYPS